MIAYLLLRGFREVDTHSHLVREQQDWEAHAGGLFGWEGGRVRRALCRPVPNGCEKVRQLAGSVLIMPTGNTRSEGYTGNEDGAVGGQATEGALLDCALASDL